MASKILLCALLGAVAVGCSDASTVNEPASDAGTPTPDSGNNRPPLGARSLEVVGDADIAAPRDSMVELQVRYFDQSGGIANANLRATLLDDRNTDVTASGIEGTFLQSGRVATDASGVGTFTVNTGPRDVTAKVRVEADDAPAVTLTVTVLRDGAGAVSVRVRYDSMAGRYTFADLDAAQIHLFERTDCDTLRGSATNLQGAYFTLPELRPFNEVDNTAVASDLDEGASFQVAATATNASGSVIAFGCVDNVSVTGGEVERVDVDLADLRLEFKGTYTVVHRFDLTDMLANTEDSTLATIAQVMGVLRVVGDGEGDRGQALVELFCEVANVSQATCDLLDGFGARLIDDVIERVVPANVLRVFTILSDVLGIFTDLTVVGEMQLDSNFDGLIPNNDNRWQKFRWTWRDGCPAGEACTREFALGDLNVNDRPIFGSFDATVEGGQMTINAHSISFRYGLIILEMAQNWVLPRVMNPPSNERVTVAEMLGAILPCAAINEGLTGDPNDDLCENILVASLAEIITDQLVALEFAADEFTISGSVTPVDTDGDLTIDQLQMGAWSGQLAITDPPLVFGGCFEGCRPPAGDTCEPAACNP